MTLMHIMLFLWAYLLLPSPVTRPATIMVADVELHCHHCCLEFSKGARIAFKSLFACYSCALQRTSTLFSSACSVVLWFMKARLVHLNPHFLCHACLCVCIMQQCCEMVHTLINTHKSFKEQFQISLLHYHLLGNCFYDYEHLTQTCRSLCSLTYNSKLS